MSTDDPSWPSDDGGAGATPPPPPPPPAPGPSGVSGAAGIAATGASLGVRFGARFIDGLITGAIGFVVGLVLGDSLFLAGIVGALIGLGYYVAFETSNGATPGKQLLKLEVVGASGAHPTVEESAKRNIFLAFQAVPVLGSIAALVAAIAIAITIQTSDDNRGLHDQFGNTVVKKT